MYYFKIYNYSKKSRVGFEETTVKSIIVKLKVVLSL